VDDTITTIYCLCDEFLKAIDHRDDPQVRLTTAEVMPVFGEGTLIPLLAMGRQPSSMGASDIFSGLAR
jgi:hypothetical protein